jgi:hypothetical protein
VVEENCYSDLQQHLLTSNAVDGVCGRNSNT